MTKLNPNWPLNKKKANIDQIHSRYTEYYSDLQKNRDVKPGYEEYGQLIENNFKMYSEIKKYDNDTINENMKRKE